MAINTVPADRRQIIYIEAARQHSASHLPQLAHDRRIEEVDFEGF
ncbi:MAG: hypothetical protein ACI8UG_000905 [Gammaproteobacteria bacterium]|jgi:hypothetical protein